MLSMLLLLAVAPQAVVPPAPPPPPSSPQATMRVLGATSPICAANGPVLTQDRSAPTLWRNESPPVAYYLLLDRQVDGCPAPIIVNDRVPGSNAISRELGRTPEPLPRYTPPSVRAD